MRKITEKFVVDFPLVFIEETKKRYPKAIYDTEIRFDPHPDKPGKYIATVTRWNSAD